MMEPGPTSSRVRSVLLLGSAGTAIGLALLATRFLLPTDNPPGGARPRGTLRVATANLAFDNARVEQVSVTLGGLDPDVLIVLEWTGKNLNLDRASGPDLGIVLDAPSPSPHGVLVLARRTLDALAVLAPTPVPGPCPMPIATVRLRAGHEWISLLGVHAPPPIEECEETNLPTLRFFAELVDRGRLVNDLGAGRRGDRVLLAGDLNASPASPGLGWLRNAGLVDFQARDRWIPRATWASAVGPHLVRLDYVLGSSEVDVLGSWTVDLPGSDHRAVIADLRIP
jgi:endonuclease/exonuclease/phosphatase (EEP) superfamily protein YafD